MSFGPSKIVDRLAKVPSGRPGAVELIARIVTLNGLTSPLSGIRSVLVHVELLEPGDPESGAEWVSLGDMVLGGDVVVLRDADGDEVSLIARRSRIDAIPGRHPVRPLERVPAELAPLLRRASGRGVLSYREVPLVEGDEVRLQAFVEPSRSVTSDGDRSELRVRYIARDDLGPVILEETWPPARG